MPERLPARKIKNPINRTGLLPKQSDNGPYKSCENPNPQRNKVSVNSIVP